MKQTIWIVKPLTDDPDDVYDVIDMSTGQSPSALPVGAKLNTFEAAMTQVMLALKVSQGRILSLASVPNGLALLIETP